MLQTLSKIEALDPQSVKFLTEREVAMSVAETLGFISLKIFDIMKKVSKRVVFEKLRENELTRQNSQRLRGGCSRVANDSSTTYYGGTLDEVTVQANASVR